MAKKRKASAAAPRATHADADADSSKRFKLNVNSWTDVADSEDEWDLSRDKILLDEGPVRKRQRQAREHAEELEDSADEVLDVPDDDDYDEGEDEDVGQDVVRADGEDAEEEGDEEGWGADDAYGADVAENEEDAREIEREAIRLQKKRLQALTDADFGFDEAEWLGQDDDGQGNHAAVGKHVEKLPEVEVTDDMPVAERQRILKARYPEFELLAKEFLELQPLAEELEVEARQAASKEENRRKRSKVDGLDTEIRLPGPVAKYNALAGYIATLAMYFAVFTSSCAVDGETRARSKPIDPKELRDHSIMDSLMKSRALWEQIRDLEITSDLDDDQDLPESDIEDQNDLSLSDEATFYTPKASPTDKLKMNLPTPSTKIKKSSKTKNLTAADRAALKARTEATDRRAAQLRKLDEDMALLNASLPTSKRSKSTTKPTKAMTAPDADDSDFGDETALTSHEAAEKARRKKTLRFYTSQIAQKAKKGEAARENGGGDADLPYRERLKDRVARLNAEAEARGRKKGTDKAADELGGSSGDEDDRALAAEIRNEANDDGDEAGEDYYQTIASRTSAKKQSDKLRREAQKEAALRGASVREVETLDEDGKRAIGYTIEKNKGLMAHRKKSVRNPRVKKKEAYEKKKKRLGSVRQVYKGGEGRGGYGGELTGIKKGVVRAVKL